MRHTQGIGGGQILWHNLSYRTKDLSHCARQDNEINMCSRSVSLVLSLFIIYQHVWRYILPIQSAVIHYTIVHQVTLPHQQKMPLPSGSPVLGTCKAVIKHLLSLIKPLWLEHQPTCLTRSVECIRSWWCLVSIWHHRKYHLYVVLNCGRVAMFRLLGRPKLSPFVCSRLSPTKCLQPIMTTTTEKSQRAKKINKLCSCWCVWGSIGPSQV